MKIETMLSDAGNPVVNQQIIKAEEGRYFQSYQSIVAFIPKDPQAKTVLDRETWNISKTTAKYRSKFLSEATHETRKKIGLGIYVLGNLNSDDSTVG